MKISRHLLAYLIVLLVCLGAISLRLEFENNAMHKKDVARAKQSAQTYSTRLTIKSDVTYSNYVAKTIASDSVLDSRVLVVGTSITNPELSSFKVSDIIDATGYLTELSANEKYKRFEHVVGVFHLTQIVDATKSSSVLNTSTEKLRDIISRGCSNLVKQEVGVCEGLLIGKRTNISYDLYSQYRKAQLTHLLVASGANIAFLVGFLMPVISRLSKNPKSLLLIFIALYYCAATRFEPSILRASVMVVIPAVGQMRGYGLSKSKIFAGTIIVCLLIDPFLIYRVGFWLSLCATGGLYFISPKIKPALKSEIIANTLSATISVQPVLWIVFGLSAPFRWPFSVVAIAIAEPLSTIGMIVICVVSVIGPGSVLFQVMILPVHMGCLWLNTCARVGASNFGYIGGCAISAIMLIAYTYKARYKNFEPKSCEANKDEYQNVNQIGFLHYRR